MRLLFILFFLGAVLISADYIEYFSKRYNDSKKVSTLGARLYMKGLNFFSQIGHKIVTRELPRLTIPNISLPIEGGPGSGNVEVESLNLLKFESPKFQFMLAPNKGITWNSRGGALRLKGLWKADYTFLAKVYLSGEVDVTASDIQSMLTVGAYSYDKHPQIQIYNCTADVTNLHMTLSGNVITWIINLFRANLASAIKTAIHKQFCDLTRSVLLAEANDALMGLETHVEITNNIFLDYGLIDNPIITKTYVEGDALIDVTIGNRTCDLPFVPVKLDAPVASKYMANMWLSQTVVDCILDSAHQSKMFKFTIDKNLQKSLAGFLRTSCHMYEICMGRFFQKLRDNYSKHYLDLVFESSTSPNCEMDAENITVNTAFFIDFHIYPSKENPDILARLQMNASSSVDPHIFNNRIVGELNSTTVTFEQLSSKIGNFNPSFLKALELILKPIITVAADTALRVGIPIPLIENVTLSNSTTLVKQKKQIRVDADLLYIN
uniref:Lipopolysaccharide-binding protein n=1 Tax=Panagrolaimus sp. ES5 TaxID=591445 RepID=A0AC34F7L1_9BILA